MSSTPTDAIGALMVACDYVTRNGFAKYKWEAHEYIGSQSEPVEYVLELCQLPEYKISFPDTPQNRESLTFEMRKEGIVRN